MTQIYHKLPIELQKLVKDYFWIWQRKGFLHQPDVVLPSPVPYYKTIRRCPRGVRWSVNYPTKLYYRRQKDYFQWKLHVHMDTSLKDIWIIEMIPQWDTPMDEKKVLHVYNTRVWYPVPIPKGAELVDVLMYYGEYTIQMEFEVIRQDITLPPSRQEMAGRFAEYVCELAPRVEKAHKQIKK